MDFLIWKQVKKDRTFTLTLADLLSISTVQSPDFTFKETNGIQQWTLAYNIKNTTKLSAKSKWIRKPKETHHKFILQAEINKLMSNFSH